MSKNIHHSDKAPDPVGLYPHARQAGNLLYLFNFRTKWLLATPVGFSSNQAEIVAGRQCRVVWLVFIHQVIPCVLEDLRSINPGWANIVHITFHTWTKRLGTEGLQTFIQLATGLTKQLIATVT